MTGALNAKTCRAVLQIAEWQEGVVEMPSGSNKVKYNTAYYGREVSGRAYPWCMAFVWWVFREAGFSLYKTASCTAFVNRYRVYAGNTGTGNDANGGAVMKRRRNVGLITVGIRPGYPDPA